MKKKSASEFMSDVSFYDTMQKLMVSCQAQFLKTFRVPLRKYWDLRTGFDVIRFDEEFIRPADDQTTNDAIEKKFGPEAVALIARLNKIPATAARQAK